ncbi:MAG: response regulator [Candidatus Omnitrophica bacterium]|nr:response regulator [Candidatus Omnitrophota bacterium]MBU4346203.1 response regulator [Candidatus Omnitrophota bacterium]MBU4473469.1 response regulator [Candidatus Omnitrophota bacterium]MCG2706196.1 response regulator [Candidatus Omnitrophota bacterium]
MKRILVVDDEERIRYIYARLLKDEGYDVVATKDANYANEVLKRENIDLILLDIKMPLVEGDILYEVVQLFHKEAKVIVTSVYHPQDQKRIIPGAADYYDKSQDLEILISKVKKVLGNGMAGGGE